MKSTRLLLAVPVLAVAMTATALMSAPAFDNFKSTLGKAEGVKAEVSINDASGTHKYTITLAKPNKARIDTASQLVVADGNEITTYVKDKNYYYTTPQTPQSLAEAMGGIEYQMWAPFFNEKAFASMTSKKTGDRKIKGEAHSIVTVADQKGDTTMEFYLSDESKMPNRLAITSKTLTGEEKMIIASDSIELAAQTADAFAFSAPANSKKVDMSVMGLGKWLHNFDEALTLAKSSNKLVMIDFMASWCGPCKMMEAQVFNTDEFKKATGNMVLVKVDVDEQQAIAQRYGISAMPTVKFVNGAGEVIHEFVGYGGFDHVMGEVKTAQNKFGK
ncbi:MAG: thioredoxin family protein [Fimbriimonadaceae bacterium]|nr:thioredoxin family protein [Fimbriimonadaceae bacterium]